jgi:hypothetical protein
MTLMVSTFSILRDGSDRTDDKGVAVIDVD